MFSPGVPPPAALGGVSSRTRRSFCRIRFDLTPRGLRLKNTHLESPEPPRTSPVLRGTDSGSCRTHQVSTKPCFWAGFCGFLLVCPRVSRTFMAASQRRIRGSGASSRRYAAKPRPKAPVPSCSGPDRHPVEFTSLFFTTEDEKTSTYFHNFGVFPVKTARVAARAAASCLYVKTSASAAALFSFIRCFHRI